MELSEFGLRARATDTTIGTAAGLQLSLLGIAGESGSVVSEAKKWLREGGGSTPALAARIEEELGDLLWYVASVSNHLGLELEDIAERNLSKTAEIWGTRTPPPSRYDEEWPDDQRLPRLMEVRFIEDRSGQFPVVRMKALGDLEARIGRARREKGLGDPLDDNAALGDGYRYHDLLHLAHASVLGWSPVLRALMGAKRKAKLGEVTPDADRIQDGGRAIAIEEGLAAFVFSFLEPYGFLEHNDRLPWELIKHIRRTVQGLEVQDQPPVAWQRTYAQAFDAFRALNEAGGGVVEADLDAQELRVRELGPQGPEGKNST